MQFPIISDAMRLERLQPPTGKVRMVLDTDTYNEIDDQFAVVYAMLSPGHLDVEALYAAPFSNRGTADPADGMEKSYEELLRLSNRLGISPDGFVFRGSTRYLVDWKHPERSEAAIDLVGRAMAAHDDPLYVIAIGAITNVGIFSIFWGRPQFLRISDILLTSAWYDSDVCRLSRTQTDLVE